MFVGDEGLVANTKFPKSALKAESFIFALFAAFAVFQVFKNIDSLNSAFSWVFSVVTGLVVLKMQIQKIRKKGYQSIVFYHDHFVVDFYNESELAVKYSDISGVNLAFEEHPTLLTLSGDYPMLNLPLYKLENEMDAKFLEYLKDQGVY